MTFLDALKSDENTEAVGTLKVRLRDEELPADVQSSARTIATDLETIDGTLDEFRSAAATVPNYFVDRDFTVEGATARQTQVNLQVIRDNDPSGLINRLENRVTSFLAELAERSKPVPPTNDAALLEALLMGARQDARDALTNAQGSLAETVLRLQQEALEGGEDALAYLLGATPWAERFVRSHGTPEDVTAFDRIKGQLRDNVSDPDAQPYRRAAERLSDLSGVAEGYRVTWKITLEESGLLIEEVKAALGIA